MPKKCRMWSEADENILKEHYPTKSRNEIISLLSQKRTPKQINNKAFRMGIRKKENEARKDGWSADDIEKLRQIYPQGEMKDIIAAFPGRSKHAIMCRASLHKIYRISSGHTSHCRENNWRLEKFNEYLKKEPTRKRLFIEFLLTVKKLDKLTDDKQAAVVAAMEHVRSSYSDGQVVARR